MNPQTIVYLEENATMQMETVQIRGIDSTVRGHQVRLRGRQPRLVVTERLLTHGDSDAPRAT